MSVQRAPDGGDRRTWGGIGWRVWRRSLRHDRAAVVAITVATLATSVFVALAPRVVEHASADDLRTAIADATPEQRNIRFELRGHLGAGSVDEPFSYVESRGRQLFGDDLPESVASIVSDDLWVFDSPTFTVSSYPDQIEGPFPTTFRFRAQEGIDDHVAVVRGAMPSEAAARTVVDGSECPDDLDDPADFRPEFGQDCVAVRLQVFETALTEQTAADMMVDVGDELTLTPDPADTRWLSAAFGAFSHRIVLRVSGIVELSDPSLEYWYADTSLHRPRITENPDFRLVFAVGLLDPDRYRQFLRTHPGATGDYTWRHLVDPDRVDGDRAEQLALDLGKYEPADGEMITLLPSVLADHLAQRSLAIQLLSMSTAGLAVVALVTVAGLALLSAVRRRAAIGLVVDRGASRPQMTADAARTGLLAAGPAALVGWLVAWRALPSTSSRDATELVVALGLLVTVVYALAVTPSRGPTGDHVTADSSSRARRWLVEGLIVGLAAAATLLLRRRDAVTVRVSTGELDWLLACAPALLALAAGVLAMRLVGPAVSVVARWGARTRGVGVFVGLRRLFSQPPAMRFPILVVATAASLVAFSSVLATSVGEAQHAASWHSVGADHRIETTTRLIPLPAGLDPSIFGDDLDVVGGTAFGSRRIIGDDGSMLVELVAVDAAALATMLERAGQDSGSLASLPATGDIDGTDRSPIPGLQVGDWPDSAGWAIGSIAGVGFTGAARDVRFVAADEHLTGIDVARPALVIDRGALASAVDDRMAQPTFYLLTGPGTDAARLAAVVDEQGLAAHVISRADRFDDVAGDPLSRWTDRALDALAGFGIAFSMIAAVSAAVIGEVVRRRDLAVLRTLGLRMREAGLLTSIEHLPFVVVSVVTGTACGIVTAHLLDPALGLDAFAGGSVPVPTVVDWPAIGLLAAVLTLGMTLVLTISTRALGRSGGARMLKVGDE